MNNNIYFNNKAQHLNALLLGTCNVEGLPGIAKRFGYNADHYLYDGRHAPQLPANVGNIYDFVVVAITLRSILEDCYSEKGYFWYTRNLSEQDFKIAFDKAVNIINEQISTMANLLPEIPVFVFSFVEPSFNPLGLLQKKHSFENIAYFIRELNKHLELTISKYSWFHYFDLNECLSLLGRERLQDDVLYMCSHGGILSNFDIGLDVKSKRIVAPMPALNFFEAYKGGNYIELIFKRLSDSLIVIKKTSPVKLIVIDLDDTLWRGIAAEDNMENIERIEGWPMGFLEALLFFKKRGGLLAINSKNEEKQTFENIERIYGDKISKGDFVSIKINWNSKVENLHEIIKETNILPQNIVVIDDNPREIEELTGVFSGLRHLGFNPYAWRGYILNGPEFQVETITNESGHRTELVKAKVQRELERQSMSNQDWLKSLNITIGILHIIFEDDKYFTRALELINKTNQFNTTGKRWLYNELKQFIESGGKILGFTAKDKLVDNGLIGIVLLESNIIEQVVLSCRVFGMDIEIVMGHEATRIVSNFNSIIQGKLVLTGKNHSCLNYFERLGFTRTSDVIWETDKICPPPDWINIVCYSSDINIQNNKESKNEDEDKKMLEKQCEIIEIKHSNFVVPSDENTNTKTDILKAELIKSKNEIKELQDALDKILMAYSESQRELMSMRLLLEKNEK